MKHIRGEQKHELKSVQRRGEEEEEAVSNTFQEGGGGGSEEEEGKTIRQFTLFVSFKSYFEELQSEREREREGRN